VLAGRARRRTAAMARGASRVIAETLPLPLARAVSSYTGIVRTLEESLHLPTEPPLHRVACEVSRGSALLGTDLHHLSGIGGAGFTRANAASAAVGEALERYSASYVPWERIVVATAAELGDEAVAPERFALFADAQYEQPGFACCRFTEHTRVAWIDGRRGADGAPAWLPAELVLLGDVVVDGCNRIGYATSNGTACAPTRDQAVERGLCELLERDAFMIVWANRLSLPRLDWSQDERILDLERRYFAATGLAYAVLDLSVFHELPSFLAVARARPGVPGALGVGAGTDASVERAWWKALSEAFAARAAGVKLALLEPERALGSRGAGVLSFEDHIRYYEDHSRATGAAFLDTSPARVPVASVPALEGETTADRVVALCGRVARAESDAYVVDVTSPDVAELGLIVTKAVAPELCALDVPHAARFLGGRRLSATAVDLGFRAEPLTLDELNPEPHPFP